MRDGGRFILVHLITSRESFKAICQSHQQILRINERSNFLAVLIGNKCDLWHGPQVGKNGE
jgi:hypothetical protein